MVRVRNVVIVVLALLLICALFLYYSGVIDNILKPHEYKGVFVMMGGFS